MANLGNVSVLNINGNQVTIKDPILTEVVNEIIEAIGANNGNISEHINDLHNRSFDALIKISSQNDSEIANIQDGIYKLQYVTITGEALNTIETLTNSAILIQKGTNQYLYKDGQISSRVKSNNTWGNWSNIITTSLSSNYSTSTDTNSALQLAFGDTYEQAFGKLEKAIQDNEEVTARSLVNLNTQINSLSNVAKTGNYNDLINAPSKTSDLVNDSGFITSIPVTSVNGQTGAVSISALPAVTSSDNTKILMVVNGAWTLVSPSTLYSGSGNPNNNQGNNGDLYIQV